MYTISPISGWREARQLIEEAITVGTDMNNALSPSAIVVDKNRYGFTINVGDIKVLDLKWFIIEHCWREMCDEGRYDQRVYRSQFGQAFMESDCLDFILRRIFRKSGLIELKKDASQTQINF